MSGAGRLDQLSIDRFGVAFFSLSPQERALVLNEIGTVPDGLRPPTPPSRTNARRTWWMREMLDRLERVTGKERSSRGRSYYRSGFVSKKFEIHSLEAMGRVRGSSRGSYHVEMRFSDRLAAHWEVVAEAIATRPRSYLEFCDGRLDQSLSEATDGNGVPLLQGLEFSNTSCTCWDEMDCKHLVAFANVLADVFEADLPQAFAFFGIDHDLLLRRVGELRTAAGSGPSIVTPLDPVDAFGWPRAEPQKRSTSTKGFGRYEPTVQIEHMSGMSRPLDVLAAIPKNRISGVHGSLSAQFARIYSAVDTDALRSAEDETTPSTEP